MCPKQLFLRIWECKIVCGRTIHHLNSVWTYSNWRSHLSSQDIWSLQILHISCDNHGNSVCAAQLSPSWVDSVSVRRYFIHILENEWFGCEGSVYLSVLWYCQWYYGVVNFVLLLCDHISSLIKSERGLSVGEWSCLLWKRWGFSCMSINRYDEELEKPLAPNHIDILNNASFIWSTLKLFLFFRYVFF